MDPQSTPSTKRCPACSEAKPLDQFCRVRANKDGLNTYCRPCWGGKRQAWRAGNRERDRENQRRWQEQNRDRSRALARAHTERHRDAINAAQRERRAADVDQARQRARDYRDARRDHYRDQERAYYATTQDTRREQAREKYRRNRQDPIWTEREWFRLRHNWRLRHAAVAAASEETVRYAASLRGEPCVYCGKASDTVDHIVPLSRGGEHHWTNLAPACFPCNRSKGATSLLLFLASCHTGA